MEMSTLSSYKNFNVLQPPQETEKYVSSEWREAREVCTEKEQREQDVENYPRNNVRKIPVIERLDFTLKESTGCPAL